MVRNMASGPMGKMMGDRLGQAFQDQTFTVYLKGNKMARIGPLTSTITDLDAGTMTNINNTKKTYTVTTFEELKQNAAEMQKRMQSTDTSVDFDVKVEKTGNTKTVDGQTATEYLLTMAAKDSGQGSGMKVVSHVWMTPSEPGADEVRAYYKKVAAQYKEALGAGGPMMGGAMKGIAAANAQLTAMDGVAVETHMEISGVQSPMGPMAQQQSSDPNAPALIMTTQNKDYTSAAVDDARFSIPAGYQKVESSMGRHRVRPQ
jgi:hypothetical protein